MPKTKELETKKNKKAAPVVAEETEKELDPDLLLADDEAIDDLEDDEASDLMDDEEADPFSDRWEE